MFSDSSNNFTITSEYSTPSDFGSIKLIYNELTETLFDGSIIWNGLGGINFPQNFINQDEFEVANTTDAVYPVNGFQNIFNFENQSYDYLQIWSSIQKLIKVREYLKSNPSATVKLFRYTPSVGVGNPSEWDWIIFMKN
ncbi:hypothetical protein LX77_01398 [Gelidibacter algens]|uniref:Uncharacterized protein n=1 Tax=Gelidibacter algens TaxID=49280 RepID=A0A1A7QQ75_9FLAO|nr:hypothetical protein [Gelidibacter algens]OBX21364.1 hypothetical protein A9996_18215 [Gelidibacter algens]RAJ25097.1 hypothetical protein LX77_01398 [Gelidibacter algens]